jgi:hypothetical protein
LNLSVWCHYLLHDLNASGHWRRDRVRHLARLDVHHLHLRGRGRSSMLGLTRNLESK